MKSVEECCPPAQKELEIPEDESVFNETFARLSKAMGHPARVAIIRLLLRREACVCGEIVDALPLAQSTVSQHLKLLKAAGLIRGEVDGPRVCYCVDPSVIQLFKKLILEL